MSDDPGGIIPPFMGDRWRKMRAHLHLASEYAEAAAKSSVPEDVRIHLGMALAEIHRADFWREFIETRGDVDDDDPRS